MALSVIVVAVMTKTNQSLMTFSGRTIIRCTYATFAGSFAESEATLLMDSQLTPLPAQEVGA